MNRAHGGAGFGADAPNSREVVGTHKVGGRTLHHSLVQVFGIEPGAVDVKCVPYVGIVDAVSVLLFQAGAEVKLKSSQTSFDMVSEQFRLGMKNTVELLTEKNNLLSAQQQRVQAKYMAILNRTLLDFYAGKDIEL